jgi:hypothetical protein
VLHPEVDDLDVVSPIARDRSARVIDEQPVILIDESLLSSPSAVTLLVGEWPIDESVLLLDVGRGYRQLPKPIVRLDVHRVDDDGSPATENAGSRSRASSRSDNADKRTHPLQTVCTTRTVAECQRKEPQ